MKLPDTAESITDKVTRLEQLVEANAVAIAKIKVAITGVFWVVANISSIPLSEVFSRLWMFDEIVETYFS